MRPLTIVADDYGIGRATSRGILELALEHRITATVLMVNCPDAELAVQEWQRAQPDCDLGWHPNLTLDFPLSPPGSVQSLVQPDGKFFPLGAFLKRIVLGQIDQAEVTREFRAQYQRFIDLLGYPPPVINSHQHVSLFPPCSRALTTIISERGHHPYIRRVVEQDRAIVNVPGARVKRSVLTLLGRAFTRTAQRHGWPGCDWLMGVTDPKWVDDLAFWSRWFQTLSAQGSVEVCCHPGYTDDTLIGRDCDAGDPILRRPRELNLIRHDSFRDSYQRIGLHPVKPSQLTVS